MINPGCLSKILDAQTLWILSIRKYFCFVKVKANWELHPVREDGPRGRGVGKRISVPKSAIRKAEPQTARCDLQRHE